MTKKCGFGRETGSSPWEKRAVTETGLDTRNHREMPFLFDAKRIGDKTCLSNTGEKQKGEKPWRKKLCRKGPYRLNKGKGLGKGKVDETVTGDKEILNESYLRYLPARGKGKKKRQVQTPSLRTSTSWREVEGN